MAYKNINLEKKDGYEIITINRPEALNALNEQTLKELCDVCDFLEDDTTLKAVILTGEGKAFIAGADIRQMKDLNSLEAKMFAELGHALLFKIQNSHLIYIAAVNGFALGGGCEVMMACDMAIASDKALIGQPEINLGIHPGFGGTQRLPRLVGRIKAMELLLTGDNIKADEALQIGLINRVVESEKLLEETEKLSKKIASKSRVQTAFMKELVNKGLDIDLTKAAALEISYFSSSFSTHDQKEGMTAFVEKRKPIFKGK